MNFNMAEWWRWEKKHTETAVVRIANMASDMGSDVGSDIVTTMLSLSARVILD